ncbi:MAG: DUF924 family protein [Pseudomonadota bacterium]
MRLYRRPPISDAANAPAMALTPVEGLALARRGKAIVAASTEALRLAEGSYPDVIYFPADHLDLSAHLPVDHQTRCPWKGEANYFDIAGASRAAWTYYEADERVAEIAGRVAYDPAHMDVDILPLPPVPQAAEQVLSFWFEETPAEKLFETDPVFDDVIRKRFGELQAAASEGACDEWAETPKGLLALIILLDQFSRNLFRGDASAFANDARAQALTRRMVENGFDLALGPRERAFAYLPYMHAEDMALQNSSVDLYLARLPGSQQLSYALGHRRTFHQYGRFPGRDEALGRS